MSFVLKVSVSEKSDASLIRVYDKSGLYNSNSNTTGFQNASTVFLANVTAATLTISITNSTTLLISTNTVTIDVFPTLPNVINTPYEVTAAMLGYTDGIIPDGMIEVEYNITVTTAGVDTFYTASVKQILIAQVCCCTKNLQSQVDACGCECEDEATAAALYAWTLLKGLKRMVRDCKKPSKAIETLLSLQQYCVSNNCLSCH